MKKILKQLGFLLLVAVFCTACGTEQTLTEDTEQELIVVGVSQIGSESVWRTANTASIQEELSDDNGYFLRFENARQKQENQIKAIRSFISQRVDYIVFSPITENGWDTVLGEAKEAGIPVIMMDRRANVEDSLFTAWVGSNFEEEGEKAGLWLEDYLAKQDRDQEELNIVVLQGTQGATSVIGRTEGFEKIALRHSNWHILEQTDAEYTTTKGREVMNDMLSAYERIDVVVSQNDDMTFGAIEAIEKKGLTTGENGDMILISFDACKAALELVEQGVINVDIECNPLQGKYVSEIIQMLERGETIAADQKECYIDEMVFTKENVSDYISSRTY